MDGAGRPRAPRTPTIALFLFHHHRVSRIHSRTIYASEALAQQVHTGPHNRFRRLLCTPPHAHTPRATYERELRRIPVQLVMSALGPIANSGRRHRITISGRMSAKIYSGEICMPSPEGDDTNTMKPTLRPVVVKAVRIVADESEPGVDLWREWRITKRLQALDGHAHVVELLEAYANKQSVFLVMEFCNQGDLLKYLMDQPGNRVAQDHALDLLLQIARGLQYLHAHNIAHRDLSLENVFLHNGICKIGDFGLSALADKPSRDCVGKTQYVAPEAVQSQGVGGAYDPIKADIWSLGVVLFMMLTGSPLVDFASPLSAEFQAFRKVGCRGVLRAWKMDDMLSFATLDLLSTMLQVDPSKRFQSVQELLDHPSLLAAAQRAERRRSRA